MSRALVVGLALVGCVQPKFYLPPTPADAKPVTVIEPKAARDIVVAPQAARTYVGDSVQFGAMYVMHDNTSVSCAATWRLGNPRVATIDRGGRLVARAPGTTSVTGMCDGFAQTTFIDVRPASLRGTESK